MQSRWRGEGVLQQRRGASGVQRSDAGRSRRMLPILAGTRIEIPLCTSQSAASKLNQCKLPDDLSVLIVVGKRTKCAGYTSTTTMYCRYFPRYVPLVHVEQVWGWQ